MNINEATLTSPVVASGDRARCLLLAAENGQTDECHEAAVELSRALVDEFHRLRLRKPGYSCLEVPVPAGTDGAVLQKALALLETAGWEAEKPDHPSCPAGQESYLLTRRMRRFLG